MNRNIIQTRGYSFFIAFLVIKNACTKFKLMKTERPRPQDYTKTEYYSSGPSPNLNLHYSSDRFAF